MNEFGGGDKMCKDEEEIWEWFEERFGKEALDRYYGWEVNELIKEVKRRAKCKELKKMEKRLEEIEKKVDWFIEYLGLGTYNYQVKVAYNITTEEGERSVEYEELTTTGGE